MGPAAFAADAWLSDVLGRPVARCGAEAALREGFGDELAAWDRAHARGFLFAKVPATQVDAVRALTARGFYPADVGLTFARGPVSGSTAMGAAGVVVEAAQPADEAAVVEIAGTAFEFSRFHLDPQFTRAEADRVKREWMKSYFAGRRGTATRVARADGQVVGFYAALVTAEAAIIDLIGVARTHQGRKVGSALVADFVDVYGPQRPRLMVGTQAANTKSVGLYERLGFKLLRSEYVLHRHTP